MAKTMEIIEKQGYRNIKKKLIKSLYILVALIIILIIVIILYFPKSCGDTECFAKSFDKCSRASLIREDSRAAWYYEITGKAGEKACNVKVKLLKMKEGKIDIEHLEGEEMICILKKGETHYPEEDINSCTGLLKEELQGIIIEKMHNYILKNLGDIKEGFGL